MRVANLAVIFMAAWSCAIRADDFRVMKLEQDVRNLERTVQDLSRQITDLRLQFALSDTRPGRADAVSRPVGWLIAANWERVQPGLSEAEVMAILGPPTSSRMEEGARVLFYALEVGPEAILAGRVSLRDGRVAEVVTPRLQ